MLPKSTEQSWHVSCRKQCQPIVSVLAVNIKCLKFKGAKEIYHRSTGSLGLPSITKMGA